MSKRLLLSVSLGLALLVAGRPVDAAEFKSGQSVSLGASQTLSGDLFAAGNDVSVDTAVSGDSFLAGSIVRSSGSVTHSLYAAGSIVTVMGNVGHAARVAGSQVSLGGTVSGDVMAAGGVVHVLPGAVINGDLYVASGNVTLEGEVKGNVRIGAGTAIVRGTVGGNVLSESEDLTVASSAKIGGNLEHRGPKEATIEQGATITGATTYQKVERAGRDSRRKGGVGAAIGFFLLALSAYLATAFVVNYFFKQRISDLTRDVTENLGKNAGWGFVWTVMIPVACFLLLFTVIGIPVSVFGFFAYCLLMWASKLLSAIILGAWLLKLVDKKRGILVDWKAILLGCIAILLVMLIPFIGWAFAAFFMFAAFGGLVNALRGIAR